jgi:hypothetical protein
MTGSGPSGMAMIVLRDRAISIARENAQRAISEGASGPSKEFEALAQFMERAEIGSVFFASRVTCFCMSDANAICHLEESDPSVDDRNLS